LQPAVEMDNHGNAVTLWTKSTGNGFGNYFSDELFVHAAVRPAGGSFDPGSDLADIGPDAYKHSTCSGPSLASAADGSAVAVWLAPSNAQPAIGNGETSPCTSVKAAVYNPGASASRLSSASRPAVSFVT